ncbi:MAG: hypothetical protein QG597_3701 [Actinomycetota bacterium]|nr:hypothetical protein [Actinomycetota bacterium]
MRRSVAAVVGGAAVLAITAAAASALTLTGPQNPRYGGSTALNCDMSFALETQTGGTGGAQITGFKVTPTGYDADECAGQSVYLKVAVVDDNEDPTADVWYMSSTAAAYSGGAQTFTLGPAGTIYAEVGNTNHIAVKQIEDVAVGNATGLVTVTGQTSGF